MAVAAPLHVEAVLRDGAPIAYEVLAVDLARSDNDHHARRVIARFEGALGGIGEDRANAWRFAASADLLVQIKGALVVAKCLCASFDLDPDKTVLRLRANGERVADIPFGTLIDNSTAAIAGAEGRAP